MKSILNSRSKHIPRAGLVVCGAISLAIFAGCNSPGQTGNVNAASTTPANQPPAAAQPQPATVVERDIVGQIPLAAQIAVPPPARADVLPPFHTTVEKVNTSVGAAVNKGDTIVQLSLPSAETYHEQTKLALQQAETDYANARKQYGAAYDAARQALASARAAESSSRAASTTTYAPDGTTTTTTTAPTDVLTASQNRVIAEQTVIQAKADMDAYLLPFKQRLEEARAANQLARANEKQGYVRAPITGTVIALNAQPGKEVGSDRTVPVATIVNLAMLQIHGMMTPNQAAQVKVGKDVVIAVDELPGKEFEGKVKQITSVPGNAKYIAIIEFKNTDAQVKPEMHAHAGIRTGQKADDVLAVPAAAVDIDSTGKPTVNVMRNGKWERVGVEMGITDGSWTEIKSGVQKGDTVQVTP